MNGSSKLYVAILIRKNEMNLEIPTLDQFNIKGNQKNQKDMFKISIIQIVLTTYIKLSYTCKKYHKIIEVYL